MTPTLFEKLEKELTYSEKEQLVINSLRNLNRKVDSTVVGELELAILDFSKAQDAFYKFLQEVFPDSKELEDVWSTYVSWFRPWNNRQNNGELRNNWRTLEKIRRLLIF